MIQQSPSKDILTHIQFCSLCVSVHLCVQAVCVCECMHTYAVCVYLHVDANTCVYVSVYTCTGVCEFGQICD